MSSPAAPDGALKPSLGVFDVVAITVSAVTPASSVFVIAPFAIQQAGSGAFLAFVMAAALALMFAWCYAELGRAHSSAGGEYVYAKRVFGGMAGYATFLAVLVSLLFIPPVLATGAATYLNGALGTQFDTQTVALVIVAASYVLGILNIRVNAWVTGVFLLCEVAALLVIVVLGFGHASQPLSVLATLMSPTAASSARNGSAGRYRRCHSISSTPTLTMNSMKPTAMASATSFSMRRSLVMKAKGAKTASAPVTLKPNISWSFCRPVSHTMLPLPVFT